MSVCKNLEEVFQGYINQVKKSEDKDLKQEREKHGHDYTPQDKPFQKGDAKIFNLGDEDSGVRDDVFRDIMKNLLHQDRRFGNFEKKILYLDCNNLYGAYLYSPLYNNYKQCVFVRICSNPPPTVEGF